ncbi:2-phospho-L-lactate guanylyltransferase [Dermatophilaceae bacterium Sec6.4]
MTSVGNSTWRVIVPVKERDHAKTRLRPPTGVDRSQLAMAFALDTLSAVFDVVAASGVFVVTDDQGVAGFVADRGGNTVRDPGRGLNPAIAAGLNAASDADLMSDQPCHPSRPCHPGAVLLGDVPCLTPADLTAALRACAVAESCVVPDADGTGTVLLTHHDLRRIVPRFGAGSAARHSRCAATLPLDLPRLRTDVDNEAAFEQARVLGVGPHTSALLGAATSVS